MKEIPLTQGKVALVDDEDFVFLSQWKWHAKKQKSGNYYAARSYHPVRTKCKTILMHCVLMAACGSSFKDHRDRNGLNNQKANLRPATKSQNSANARIRTDNKSGLKGVFWFATSRSWAATIRKNGVSRHLGLFPDRISAARAYDAAAIQLFGEFAKTNSSMNLI